MARALIGSRTHEIDGEGLALTWTVLFYGADVPNGADSTICRATLTAAMTPAQIRDALRAAIAAEASRLGYPYQGGAVLIDLLFAGL